MSAEVGRKHDSLSRDSEEPAAHLAPPGGPLLCQEMSTFCPTFHNGNNQTEGWFLSISHDSGWHQPRFVNVSLLFCCQTYKYISCRVTKLAVLESVRCDWGCRLDLGCKWAWRVPSCDRSSCLFRSRLATSHFLPASSLFISLACCPDSRHLSISPKSWSETFTDRWWKCSRMKDLEQTQIWRGGGGDLWIKTYFFQVTCRPGYLYYRFKVTQKYYNSIVKREFRYTEKTYCRISFIFTVM